MKEGRGLEQKQIKKKKVPWGHGWRDRSVRVAHMHKWHLGVREKSPIQSLSNTSAQEQLEL